MTDNMPERRRRPRYHGKNPRRFSEKYKELNPDKYAEDVQKILQSGKTPAGMHRSVMTEEILSVLKPAPGERGLDATLGYGGHAQLLLDKIRPGGQLWALDVDPIEIDRTRARLRERGYGEEELKIQQLNFAGVSKLLGEAEDGFDFIVADLGVSSMQLDNPERGFSYKADGPLDLRLNPKRGQSAAAFLEKTQRDPLSQILRFYSDEPYAEEIAEELCLKRGRIATTTALASAVRHALRKRSDELPETEVVRSIRRTFQTLRIQVNDELSALEQFLRQLPGVLKGGGRAAVLSFHSGEDRRVAQALQEGFEQKVFTQISTTPIRAGRAECYANPRASSALLRWAVRS